MEVCMTPLHVIAIAITILRLEYRQRTHKLWWDDMFALFALVMDCVYLVNMWLRAAPEGNVLQSTIQWHSC